MGRFQEYLRQLSYSLKKWSKAVPHLPYILLLLTIFAIYYRTLNLPFVQDDWAELCWLEECNGYPAMDFLKMRLSLDSPMWYRPLANLWLVLMHTLFGVNPFPYHVISFIVFFLNVILVIRILLRLYGDELTAWIAGFLYAGAFSIHLETMLWSTGIWDLGVISLSLLAFLLFLRGAFVLSAIAWLAGLFFKETVIGLPLILLAVSISENGVSGKAFKKLFANFLPYLLAGGFYFAIKLQGTSPFQLPDWHPYYFDLFSVDLFVRMYKYFLWSFHGLAPFLLQASDGTGAMVMVAFFLCLILPVVFIKSKGESDLLVLRGKNVVLPVVWFLIGLIPMLFLKNHTTKMVQEIYSHLLI